ncbi:hypothetical protein BJ170DRAFT_685874 [Xylariales sp. AK1849]|nr:hypothetical protein BJ170DRAFT_685874 [Xylariales sp. AK1849]
MPPKKNTERFDFKISESERKIINVIFTNCASSIKPKPDNLDELAGELGLKSGRVLNTRYHQICTKLGWFVPNNNPGTATPKPSKQATVTPRSSKANPAKQPPGNMDADVGGFHLHPDLTRKRKMEATEEELEEDDAVNIKREKLERDEEIATIKREILEDQRLEKMAKIQESSGKLE